MMQIKQAEYLYLLSSGRLANLKLVWAKNLRMDSSLGPGFVLAKVLWETTSAIFVGKGLFNY